MFWMPVMPRRAGLSVAGCAPSDSSSTISPPSSPPTTRPSCLCFACSDRVERLTGDQGFEDDVHAQRIAVERQRAVHVGHPDDEVAERDVGQNGHHVLDARRAPGGPRTSAGPGRS